MTINNIMSGYDKFKNDVIQTYPQFIDKNKKDKYVYKLVDDNLIVLKQINTKEKNIYIVNDDYARHFGEKLLIKLICKMGNLKNSVTKVQSANSLSYEVNSVVSTHFYKSLEIIYYKYVHSQPNFTGKIMGWHNNGCMVSSGNYFLGKKNGFWTFWYDNNEKRLTGNYIDGKRDGLFTEWNKLGQKSRQIEYKNDKSNGTYISWYPNGNEKKKGNYHDGKKIGEWKYYNEKGIMEKNVNAKYKNHCTKKTNLLTS